MAIVAGYVPSDQMVGIRMEVLVVPQHAACPEILPWFSGTCLKVYSCLSPHKHQHIHLHLGRHTHMHMSTGTPIDTLTLTLTSTHMHTHV